MPLICHLAAWKLDMMHFGFADKNREELQDLVPQPKHKKPKTDIPSRRTTRSQGHEEAHKQEEQKKQETEDAAATWKKILEEHHREKEA